MSLTSSSPAGRPRRRRTVLGAAVAVSLLGLVGCGSDDSGSGSADGASSDGAAVTIKHAFGETTITSHDRVVALGWGAADAMMALGVEPVALEKQSYGATAEGTMPWIAEKIEAEGWETPTLLTTGEAPAYEEIIKTKPDLILAPYSGIDEKAYDQLSKIAPTVAYPETPWSTPWRDTITITGTAIGKKAEAEDLVEEIDGKVAEQAEAHPEFAGKSIAAVATDANKTFYVYTEKDPRVEFLTDLGFTSAPSVTELYNGDSSFFYTLSPEKLDGLTSDVLLEYLEDDATDEAFNSDPAVAAMEQVKAGDVAKVKGASLISSVSPPTALSLTWGLEDFVSALSAATKG